MPSPHFKSRKRSSSRHGSGCAGGARSGAARSSCAALRRSQRAARRPDRRRRQGRVHRRWSPVAAAGQEAASRVPRGQRRRGLGELGGRTARVQPADASRDRVTAGGSLRGGSGVAQATEPLSARWSVAAGAQPVPGTGVIGCGQGWPGSKVMRCRVIGVMSLGQVDARTKRAAAGGG